MDIYVCHISVEIYPTTRENKQALCIGAHGVGECVDWFIWISPSCGLPTVAECGKTGSAKNKENFAHD